MTYGHAAQALVDVGTSAGVLFDYLNAHDIDPGTYVPRIMKMTDFNLWA